MTKVVKYNTYKGFSTALTFGTPLVTMCCVGDVFIQQPATAISGAAIFALLLAALFAKDKLAEKFKCPSALVIAIIVFVFCCIVEKVIQPLKIISLMAIVSCGVDELTFKGFYKRIELSFPQTAQSLKRFGFYATRQTTIDQMRGESA